LLWFKIKGVATNAPEQDLSLTIKIALANVHALAQSKKDVNVLRESNGLTIPFADVHANFLFPFAHPHHFSVRKIANVIALNKPVLQVKFGIRIPVRVSVLLFPTVSFKVLVLSSTHQLVVVPVLV